MAKYGSIKQYVLKEVLPSQELNQVLNEIGGHPIIGHDATTGARRDFDLGDPASGSVGHVVTDIYQREGKKLKIVTAGGTISQEIDLTASGGGGASLELIDLVCNNKKIWNIPPKENYVTNETLIAEAFDVDNNVVLTLGKDYSTADTTSIFLDKNATVLDNMNATTGWTASAGSVSVDTTNKVEGTGSVLHSVTSLNGSANISKSISTGSVYHNFMVWCRFSTLVNLATANAAQVIFETSSGNYRTFSFPVSRFTVNVFEQLYCDFQDSTKYTDTGTFNPAGITKVYLVVNTSASQTLTINWDFLRREDSWPLVNGNIQGFAIPIYDSTNQEMMIIRTENSTIRGKYTLAATLSYSYTIATSYAKLNTGTTEYMEHGFQAAASGKHAVENHCITRKMMNKNQANKNLYALASWRGDRFLITDFTDTNTIKISGDYTARFKNGDKLVMFKLQRFVQQFEGYYNATLQKNYKELTINADSTFGSSKTTITHTESNATGGDISDWYITKKAIFMKYFVGELNDDEVYTELTPSIFIPRDDGDPIIPGSTCLYIPFDNADTSSAIDIIGGKQWTKTGTVSYDGSSPCRDGYSFPGSNSGYYTLLLSNDAPQYTTYFLTNQNFGTLEILLKGVMNGGSNRWIVSTGSYFADSWVWALMQVNGGYALEFQTYYASAVTSNLQSLFADNKWHYVVVTYDRYQSKQANTFEIFVDGENKRASGANSSSGLTGFTFAYHPRIGVAYDVTSGWPGSYAEWLLHKGYWMSPAEIARRYNSGRIRKYMVSPSFTVAGMVAAQSGKKCCLDIVTSRKDSTNEVPKLRKYGSVIV